MSAVQPTADPVLDDTAKAAPPGGPAETVRATASVEPAERPEFLAEAGLKEAGLNQVIRSGYQLLGLITYLTAGEKECRAWTIPRGWTAPQAAGVIHTDFERGFIKAEVIDWRDLLHYGSEAKCREAGKVRIEGKAYVVQDGDVMHFRFNT